MAQTPIQLYHQILEALDLQADSTGLVSHVEVDGALTPCTIENRRVTLPTDEALRTIAGDGRIAFHPLSENITLGESLIIRRLNTWVTSKLSTMMTLLGMGLLQIATEKGPLTAETTELGKALADATPKTVDHFASVINKIDLVNHRLVKIYIKRKGTLNGQSYRRVAVVRFPIMEEFAEGKPENMIFGEKITKKDKRVIHQLFKFMLPLIETENAYSAGTNSSDAPNFVALMTAFYNVASGLVKHSEVLKSKLKDPVLHPPLDWIQYMDKLNQFAGTIPPLDGNEGAMDNGSERVAPGAAVNAAPAAVAPVSPAYPTAQPMAAPTPVGRYQTSNTVGQTETTTQPVTQPAQPVAQPVQPGVPQPGQPVFANPYLGFPQQQVQPMQPDFASMVTMNTMANQGVPVQPMGMPMPGMMSPMPMGMMPGMPMPGMPMPGMPVPQMPMGIPGQPYYQPQQPVAAGYPQPAYGMPPQQPMAQPAYGYPTGNGAGRYQTR